MTLSWLPVRSGRRGALRAALVALLTLLGYAVTPAPWAVAAPEPGSATFTGVTLEGRSVSGLLTVRDTGAEAEVDPKTIKVSVGGRSVEADVSEVVTSRRATMLVVDISGSMRPEDMATMRAAVRRFLDEAPGDVQVGLTVFSGDADLVLPVGPDRTRVQAAVDRLEADGETALYDAVVLAAKNLRGIGDRSIVLLSDGGDTASDASQAAAVRALRSGDIRAEMIAFKTEDTDTRVLGALARAGNGSVTGAQNPAAVTTAFRNAALALESQVSLEFEAPESLSGPQEVVVSGRVAAGAFTARTSVDLGAPVQGGTATPGATTAGGAASLALPQPWWLPAALGAIFLGLLGLTGGVLAPRLTSQRKLRVDSIERYLSGAVVSVRGEHPAATPSTLALSLISVGDRVMARRSSTLKTMALLERADLRWRPGEWFVLRGVSVVGGVALGMLVIVPGVPILGALVGMLLGFAVPGLWLRWRASRRAKRFEGQLPDVLMLVSSSLQSGFSLVQSLDSVARDGAEPASKEISRALAEARIGTDISDALERVGDRMGSTNMRWTAMAVRIQREVGGNLAETLRTTAGTLRERESLRRHVAALSAEGKLSAYILVALPIFMFLYLVQANYEYVSLLWTRPVGWLMLIAIVVSMTIGIFWMRRVVKVEV